MSVLAPQTLSENSSGLMDKARPTPTPQKGKSDEGASFKTITGSPNPNYRKMHHMETPIFYKLLLSHLKKVKTVLCHLGDTKNSPNSNVQEGSTRNNLLHMRLGFSFVMNVTNGQQS